jgi:hypothetical protein
MQLQLHNETTLSKLITCESNCPVLVHTIHTPQCTTQLPKSICHAVWKTTKSCISPVSCFYLYSLNAIPTETIAPKSNDSHRVIWVFSTARSNCELKGAVTSERKNKESRQFICTYSQNCKQKPTI